MRFAIFESILTAGGHEVDFDRILVEELQNLGHEVTFYVPENFEFKFDYQVPIVRLKGNGVSYQSKRGLDKIFASVKREVNRQRWFKQLYHKATDGDFDAIIVPTSTYRYLRALNINVLKNSPIPVIFILHGINPGESQRFTREVKKLQQYHNIKAAVLTFSKSIFGQTLNNVHCINPPTYTPRDIEYRIHLKKQGTLRLGFFGQYRREKNLDGFLDTFLSCKFNQPVEIFVQGATVSPADAEDFERIIAKYTGHKQISFLHKGLFGRDWQQAIASVDAIIMPYSSSRYLYHWAGMLFTAIGFGKPVVASNEINPEVLDNYCIGTTFNKNNQDELKSALEVFINTYYEQAVTYEEQLQQCSQDFSPRRFAQQLVDIAEIRESW